jgi:hypothetical protein
MKKRAPNGTSETNAERLVAAGLGDIRVMVGITLAAQNHAKATRLGRDIGIGLGAFIEKLISEYKEQP